MSFTFKWPKFSEQFHAEAIQLLDFALNKGSKPPVIVDRIHVVDLKMGIQPPELEIRDIGDLSMNQFRGIFRLTYAGDAHVVLRTKVQVNPLHHKKQDIHFMGASRGMLAASQPLVVPMLLRLSNFKLNSYVVLVVSRQKGITLVFKTDPLQSVDISSTFDSISIVQTFIQAEIEDQLRRMFREDLPNIIHRLSQRWVTAAAYGSPMLNRHTIPRYTEKYVMSTSHKRFVAHPQLSSSFLQQKQNFDNRTIFSKRYIQVAPDFLVDLKRRDAHPHSTEFSPLPIPTTCNVEPFSCQTYSGDYTSFRRRLKTVKGLACSNPEDSQSYINPSSIMPNEANVKYETLPAVGGGTIIRPRIYHSSSLLYNAYNTSGPLSILSNAPIHSFNIVKVDNVVSSHFSSRISQNSSLAYSSASSPSTTSYAEPSVKETLGVFLDTHTILSDAVTESNGVVVQSLNASPSSPINHPIGCGEFKQSSRKASFSSTSQWTDQSYQFDLESEIVVRPAMNNTVSQLSALNFANHTLSPFTRNLEHFTIRSVPPKKAVSTNYHHPSDKQQVKARRKGTHYLSSKRKSETDENKFHVTAALAPEFEISEIDRYFRACDDQSRS